MPDPILSLSRNTQGRDFVVGDIHGEFSLLESALESISFDRERDRLICCGDLIDRGPESHRALEFLLKPWFYSMKFFLSCPIKGVRKSYALWVEADDRFQPLVYFQKPKWLKDDASWERFVRGVYMAISHEGHAALSKMLESAVLESAVLESAVLDREASND